MLICLENPDSATWMLHGGILVSFLVWIALLLFFYSELCQDLNLNNDILAKFNHKGLSVEYFHRFLNKSVTITADERATSNVFVPTGIAAGYAWSSAPIDGIYIYSSQYSSDR